MEISKEIWIRGEHFTAQVAKMGAEAASKRWKQFDEYAIRPIYEEIL
jgi:hypothetical protein